MSEFKVPRPNLYESSRGFSVEVLGRTGLRYVENGWTVFVDSEVLAAPGGILVYKDSARFWDPSEGNVLSSEDRQRVIENIRAALLSQGIQVDVI